MDISIDYTDLLDIRRKYNLEIFVKKLSNDLRQLIVCYQGNALTTEISATSENYKNVEPYLNKALTGVEPL
jgi:hypothetical protein